MDSHTHRLHMLWSLWAATTESIHTPQLLKPARLEPVLCNKRSHSKRRPSGAKIKCFKKSTYIHIGGGGWTENMRERRRLRMSPSWIKKPWWQLIPLFCGKDWKQEEKGATEEKVGWHYWLNGHEFEQIQRDREGQGSLACCSSWGHKKSDMT